MKIPRMPNPYSGKAVTVGPDSTEAEPTVCARIFVCWLTNRFPNESGSKFSHVSQTLVLCALTSLGERMEMKSSYICRTFSSTTVLLVSFLSSSQASQNIMFSSLNSVLRNCLKQLRPAALFITFSNDSVQERASSRVGFGLGSTRIFSFHENVKESVYTE